MWRMAWIVASFLMASIALAAPGVAQQFAIPNLPADAHLLDPLLGRWTYVEDLHDPQHYRPRGTWTFAKSADGFVVFDEFRTANGSGGTAVLVDTFRAYNPTRRTWSFQATIYQAPMIGTKNGEWDEGVTRIQDGEIFDEIIKGDTITRAKFYNIRTDTFSCRLDTSNDGGKTWVKPVDIDAVRAS